MEIIFLFDYDLKKTRKGLLQLVEQAFEFMADPYLQFNNGVIWSIAW